MLGANCSVRTNGIGASNGAQIDGCARNLSNRGQYDMATKLHIHLTMRCCAVAPGSDNGGIAHRLNITSVDNTSMKAATIATTSRDEPPERAQSNGPRNMAADIYEMYAPDKTVHNPCVTAFAKCKWSSSAAAPAKSAHPLFVQHNLNDKNRSIVPLIECVCHVHICRCVRCLCCSVRLLGALATICGTQKRCNEKRKYHEYANTSSI